MRNDSNTQYPEHFIDEEEPQDASAETASENGEMDSNFETEPRVDFESADESL